MLLARGARPYGRASNGESVLHSCAREGHLELTATLLHQVSLQATEWPFPPHPFTLLSSFTPLSPCSKSLIDSMPSSSLLSRAHVNQSSAPPYPAAHMWYACLQLKCDNPSDRGMVNWRNRVGSTPLHTAVAHNQNETARLLMQQVLKHAS